MTGRWSEKRRRRERQRQKRCDGEREAKERSNKKKRMKMLCTNECALRHPLLLLLILPVKGSRKDVTAGVTAGGSPGAVVRAEATASRWHVPAVVFAPPPSHPFSVSAADLLLCGFHTFLLFDSSLSVLPKNQLARGSRNRGLLLERTAAFSRLFLSSGDRPTSSEPTFDTRGE